MHYDVLKTFGGLRASLLLIRIDRAAWLQLPQRVFMRMNPIDFNAEPLLAPIH